MIQKISTLIVVILIAGMSPAHAVKLRYRAKKGDSWKTTSVMKASGKYEVANMNLDFELDAKSITTQRVEEIQSDGSFVSSIDQISDYQKVKVGGNEVPEQPQQPIKPLSVTHSVLGKIIKIVGLEGQVNPDGGPNIGLIMSTVAMPFPEVDVKVGDSWEVSADQSLIPVKITGKLLEVGKEGNIDVVKISYTMSLTGEGLDRVVKDLVKPQQEIGFSGPGITSVSTVTIDLATGIAIRSKSDIEADITAKLNNMDIRETFKGTIEDEVSR